MLILTRNENQSLYIFPSDNLNPDMTVQELFQNGAIEIKVTQILDTQVKLGINASKFLDVLREELMDND